MPKKLNPPTKMPKKQVNPAGHPRPDLGGGINQYPPKTQKNLENKGLEGAAGPRLNPQQKTAAEAPFKPLLIVAGAGTGKTTTLTERLAHLIRTGVPPRRICALTFTNKAAQEMLERVERQVGSAQRGERPHIGTFHSFGAKILRREGHLLGRTSNFAIFDDHDSFEIVKKILKGLEGYKPPEKAEKKSRERPARLHQKIAEVKNTGQPLEPAAAREKEDFLALKVFAAYERRLAENNAFDFDDLIEKVVFLWKNRPEVLAKYQNAFDAVLVDEYQDLNPIQYDFVKLLAGAHKNVSVVGDDEQLIYGWRYADLETFLAFETDWPGAQVAFLEENYRSTGNIIAAAAAISKNNLRRRPKNLWTKNPAGEKIKITEVSDENEEAEIIATQIELIQSQAISQKSKSVAVLYRTNAQSRAIEQALLRRQIPYRIFGGLKFYERKEIKDVVAGLRYAMNNKDEISRERLEKTFSQKTFARLEAALRNAAGSPQALIEQFLEATEYLDYLERNYSNFLERQENITELIHFASRFENLADLLQDIALIQATDDRTATSNQKLVTSNQPISLMTIHLAKGLEFDTVFIAGCSEGLLPHARSIEDDERMEEERRLMYVAMTRAAKELFISFYDVPSRFIGEIPEELVEFIPLRESDALWGESEEYVTLE